MARRRKSALAILFAPSTGTNRNLPPAAQFGFGKRPKRGNTPFVDKPYRGW